MDLDLRFYNETHFGKLITDVYESPLYMDKYIDEYFIQSGKIRTERLCNEFIKNSNRYCADTANSSVENEEIRVLFEERIKSLIHTLKYPLKPKKQTRFKINFPKFSVFLGHLKDISTILGILGTLYFGYHNYTDSKIVDKLNTKIDSLKKENLNIVSAFKISKKIAQDTTNAHTKK